MNMKKRIYEEPNIAIYIFEHEDIVTLSNGGTNSDVIRPFSNSETDLGEEGY